MEITVYMNCKLLEHIHKIKYFGIFLTAHIGELHKINTYSMRVCKTELGT